MKAVVLAGGYGTRISEESAVRPKPMVEIGEKPILWHIMKLYAANGVTEFVVAAGYRGYLIKEYFANYYLHTTDVTVDLQNNTLTPHASTAEPWRVTIVDTGDGTMTGGRLARLRDYVGDDTFCLTYGDCVSDLDVAGEIDFHRRSGAAATVTAVQPPGRFGALTLRPGGTEVEHFMEKPTGDGGWVNGGFFVFEPTVFDYIESDATVLEREPLERLATGGKLTAYKHTGFWHPMDTLRDKVVLEELWSRGDAPWKVW
ncbi:MAG: glucose-1-phosphate cytidylyltransferase [Actinomycetota bacterium]|nr:glucose-1-phosphate cytidylyltransferase [Actinomycetota bacterium]